VVEDEESKWLEQCLQYEKEYLLYEVERLTQNKIREKMGNQEFIDHWKLRKQEYMAVVDGQSKE
jgi:hypothetical protein